MRRLAFLAVPAGVLALAAVLWSWHRGPAAEQPADPVRQPSGNVRLPITQLSLFSSGVAFVQRQGEVNGNERIVLSFPVKDVNDLLKSLEVEDQGGGQVSTVGYASQDPIDKALQSYTINLAGSPSFAQVLNQARGEKVEVQMQPAAGLGLLNGSVMGVDKQRQTLGKDVIEHDMLTLWCADGMRSVKVAEVLRVRFLNPLLDGDVKKALDLLTQTHNTQDKTVALNCTGKGKRTIHAGYVIEHPMWKTSYRLTLGKDEKTRCKGWAMVENPTAEDWRDVRLNLVVGRPISFRMDLYTPLYVPRPLVEPELFAGLRPPRYSGPLDQGLPRPGESARLAPDKKPEAAAEAPAEPPVKAVAVGDAFVYSIDTPVSLPRHQSALVPILYKDIAARKVSIYNEKVLAKHPLLGLRYKNTTGLHLNQGPVTVYEENTYGGDAQLPDLQPNEERLLSYAIDVGTEVSATAHDSQQRLTSVKIHKGILQATKKIRESKVYVVRNRSDRERVVLIEHPVRPEFALQGTVKPIEMSRDVYRFEIKAVPEKTQTFTVFEERTLAQMVVLSNSADDELRFYVAQPVLSEQVKAALARALELKGRLNETRAEARRVEADLKTWIDDQARIRANLERLHKEQEAYKRQLKKLDELETEIEKRQANLRALRETENKQRKEYEDFLAGLSVG